MVNKVYGLLGISAKAGKIVAGNDLVIEEMSKNKVKLVIIATDASEKTIKNIIYYCEKYNIKNMLYGTIDELSKSIGKHNKAIIGIEDQNLAEALKKQILDT